MTAGLHEQQPGPQHALTSYQAASMPCCMHSSSCGVVMLWACLHVHQWLTCSCPPLRRCRQEDMTQAAKRLGIEMVGSSGHVAEDASLERVKALWAHCPKPPKRPKLNPPEEQQQQQQLTGAVGGEAHGGGTAAAVAGRGDGAAVAQAKVQAATMSGAGENQAALSMDGKAAVSAMSGTGDA